MAQPSTYSGDPNNSALDLNRYLTGDRGPTRFELNDAEHWFRINEQSGASASAIALRTIQDIEGYYARKVDRQVDSTRSFDSQRVKQLEVIKRNLRLAVPAEPYVGGASVSDKEAIDADLDRVSLPFKSGMQ